MKVQLVAVLLGGMVASAQAEAILTFGFTDLSGSFNVGTSEFSADAVDTANLSTAGDVTRLSPVGATATYNDGFVSRSAFADVGLSMDVTNILANSADGNGSILITDNDGDTIVADIDGVFSNGGFGIYYFTGYLSNVFLSGTTFNGPDGGSFGMDLPGNEPYEGALVQLFIANNGNFFANSFTGRSVQLSGIIVPAPGVLGIAGAGLLLGARRRR